jgi:L-aminopeptidase/D-esterase-like protein
MQWLRVGHVTQREQGTGVSVFLFDRPAVGAYCLCGASPATAELGVLDLAADVTHLDGLMFAGGSALGLPALKGVSTWFQEQGRGWPAPFGAVPIVPAAAIYDFGVKQAAAPSESDAYQACLAASLNDTSSGRIGAGTGATIGKLVPGARPMSGGIGRAEIVSPAGISVLAYALVNSVGDIQDDKGQVIAGARLQSGEFAHTQSFLSAGHTESRHSSANTTLVAIFTNALFSKIACHRIGKMAMAGMARAISPVFTRYDGDIIFCVSLGDHIASEMMMGAMAAEAVQLAIRDAVKESVIL